MVMTGFELDVFTYCLVGISLLSLVRVVIGPTPEDRMMGLNLAAAQVLAVLVLAAVRIGHAVFLDVALVYVILGFVGVLTLSRYVSRKEKEE